MEKIDLNSLDKNLCYSFVMQHPENKICNNISVKYCAILNSIDLEKMTVIRHTTGLMVEKSIEEILFKLESSECHENYIVYLPDDKRIKLLAKSFREKQELIKNDPNMKRVYLRCMKEGTTELLRQHFPQEKELFNLVEYRFYDVAKEIHRNYMDIYVRKQDALCDPRYEKSLKQLHWRYHQTREKITLQKVQDMMNDLTVKILMYVLDM
jgi:hypothetical protein